MGFLEQEKHDRFLCALEHVRGGFARFCRAISSDNESARDLASESILILYEKFDSLRDPVKFKSYLFTTAARLEKRRRHRERNKAPFDTSELELRISAEPAPDANADIELLYDALAKLPTEQRDAVVLFEISGLTLEEIRRIQGGSLSGVKSRIARARKKLRELLGVSDDVGEVSQGLTDPVPRTLVYARTTIGNDVSSFGSDKLSS
ncbi:MAG TPA: sigma-70 family RNA polymerase sigma factor [Candidatus Kapabacteria bacterium]|nr:sigma-70 family RNA polymerase sigma factor [Candidatus Kapabacteria bacterium]